MLVCKRVQRAHLRVGAIHARDPRCNDTELVHVCDGVVAQINLRDLNFFVIRTCQRKQHLCASLWVA